MDDAASHLYCFPVPVGKIARVRAEQLDLDLTLRLFDPVGRLLTQVDSPNGGFGPETVEIVGTSDGLFCLAVEALRQGEQAGRYRLELEQPRAADSKNLERIAAERAFAEANRWQARGEERHARRALELFSRALRQFEVVGDSVREAESWERTAELWERLGKLPRALESYHQAEILFEEAGLPLAAARVLNSQGPIHRRLGNPHQAREAYERALAHARGSTGGIEVERTALFNLARLAESEGAWQDALEVYQELRVKWHEAARPEREAKALISIASAQLALGNPAHALGSLEEALHLVEGRRPSETEILILDKQGRAHRQLGDLLAAQTSFEQALGLAQNDGDQRLEAMVLNNLGLIYPDLGAEPAAEQAFEEALAIYQQLGMISDEAVVLFNRAALDEKSGRPEEALRRFPEALALFRRQGSRSGQASALHGMARAEARLGRFKEAYRHAEAAVGLVEDLRAGSAGEGPRVSYLAFKRPYYELSVDLLMNLHRSDPSAGYVTQALAAAERTRARGLLDSLGNTQLDLKAVEPPVPLDFAGIQRQVLDEDSQLLAYFLGEKRSFAWLVDRTSIASYTLPPREKIEAAARASFEALARSHERRGQGTTRLALAELTRLVVSPMASALTARRLLIVPDGALHYVPFSALPDPSAKPSSTSAFLIDRFEIVTLPSASLIPVLRERVAIRSPPHGTLAVVASPLYSSGSNRPTLRHARAEAETVLALAPSGRSFAAFGPAASRASVTGGALEGFRYIHFATHGRFDAARPDLSGLLLSDVDDSGHQSPGLLSAEDVYHLRLSADLVVLSACQTALGQEIRGEGIVGLTRGFLHAGVPRVVVSLWQVDDRATAALMERLYVGIFTLGLPPAAALRRAQLDLRRERRWREPYYWAAFIFHGEWR